MSNTILLKDSDIAFSVLPHQPGEAISSWPTETYISRWGYFVPFDNYSGSILDYLEVGPEKFRPQVAFKLNDKELNRGTCPTAVLVTRDARVYELRLILPHPESDLYPALNATRIFHGPGAAFAVAETSIENDRAFMAMKLSTTIEDALDLYERNTNSIQFTYKVISILQIAQQLRQRWQSPLPNYPFRKPQK